MQCWQLKSFIPLHSQKIENFSSLTFHISCRIHLFFQLMLLEHRYSNIWQVENVIKCHCDKKIFNHTLGWEVQLGSIFHLLTFSKILNNVAIPDRYFPLCDVNRYGRKTHQHNDYKQYVAKDSNILPKTLFYDIISLKSLSCVLHINLELLNPN